LFVGEVGVRKGVPWLLEAFARLPADWTLHLVGPSASGTRQLLARLPNARVVFRGVLSGDALAAAYREADIFCLPSIEEGFGMVILQAMASGLPVVATRATGGPDVGVHGRELLIVQPGDSSALAEALVRLAEDPDLRHALGTAAAARVATGFSWDDYGQRAIGIIRQYHDRQKSP
jgi:glycosyltransferase involved in cell wall biosynthesis